MRALVMVKQLPMTTGTLLQHGRYCCTRFRQYIIAHIQEPPA